MILIKHSSGKSKLFVNFSCWYPGPSAADDRKGKNMIFDAS